MARLAPKIRRAHILQAAIEVARDIGYLRITGERVAAKAGMSRGLITRYFESMEDLTREVMRGAIRLEIYEIVFQGLAVRDPIAMEAPEAVRAEALKVYSR